MIPVTADGTKSKTRASIAMADKMRKNIHMNTSIYIISYTRRC